MKKHVLFLVALLAFATGALAEEHEPVDLTAEQGEDVALCAIGLTPSVIAAYLDKIQDHEKVAALGGCFIAGCFSSFKNLPESYLKATKKECESLEKFGPKNAKSFEEACEAGLKITKESLEAKALAVLRERDSAKSKITDEQQKRVDAKLACFEAGCLVTAGKSAEDQQAKCASLKSSED